MRKATARLRSRLRKKPIRPTYSSYLLFFARFIVDVEIASCIIQIKKVQLPFPTPHSPSVLMSDARLNSMHLEAREGRNIAALVNCS